MRCMRVYVAVPTFKQVEDAPYDTNKTIGGNVQFHCNPYAIPEAKIEWYKNGERINRMYFYDWSHYIV